MSSESQALRVLNLFEKYYERVYCFARRSVDAQTAEDIAQDVFTRLLDLPDLETRIIESSYLIKIADNLLKRRYRKLQQAYRHAAGERDRVEGKACRPGDRAVGGEVWESDLAESLRHLSECEQDAVQLIILRGLSYDEAAAALGVKTSSVNNWKFRGLQRLKQHSSPKTAAGRNADASGSTRGSGEREQSGRARYGQRAG